MGKKFIREEGLPYPQPWEFVLEQLNSKKGGVFIDIGAYDGLRASNTGYMEYDLGWSGICVEANPEVFKTLKENRDCLCENYAVSNKVDKVNFLKIDGFAEMISGIVEKYDDSHRRRVDDEISRHGGGYNVIEIDSIDFNTLIGDKYTNIDYVSIDVEGSEFDIISSIDFKKYDIKYISSENNYNDTTVEEYLNSKDYSKLANVCGDDIFKKNDR